MNNGGREALLQYLLDYDLAAVNLRAIPKTAALLEQKLSTLSPEQGWWLDLLRSGQLPHGTKDQRNEVPAVLLFHDYLCHAGNIGARHRALETQLGIFLRKVVGGAQLLKSRNRTYVDKYGFRHQGSFYIFPPLAMCRAKFVEQIGQQIAWGPATDWLPTPYDPPEGAQDDLRY
jgi:hypothetical protein